MSLNKEIKTKPMPKSRSVLGKRKKLVSMFFEHPFLAKHRIVQVQLLHQTLLYMTFSCFLNGIFIPHQKRNISDDQWNIL